MCAFSKDDSNSVFHLAFSQCDQEMESVSLLPWIGMAGDSWLSRSKSETTLLPKPNQKRQRLPCSLYHAHLGVVHLVHTWYMVHTWPLLHWGCHAGRERTATQRGHPKALQETGRSSEHPRGQACEPRRPQVIPAPNCSVTPRCGVKCVGAKPIWPFQIVDTNIVKLLLLYAKSLPWSVMQQ